MAIDRGSASRDAADRHHNLDGVVRAGSALIGGITAAELPRHGIPAWITRIPVRIPD